ncbi:hypothetical protein SHEWT2_01224 [Shewanella hafniensis]|nr:hypothetical protein SHEWT2_01224 [Shewanella hafniensis]
MWRSSAVLDSHPCCTGVLPSRHRLSPLQYQALHTRGLASALTPRLDTTIPGRFGVHPKRVLLWRHPRCQPQSQGLLGRCQVRVVPYRLTGYWHIRPVTHRLVFSCSFTRGCTQISICDGNAKWLPLIQRCAIFFGRFHRLTIGITNPMPP